MNDFLIPALDYLRVNPFAFINIVSVFVILHYILTNFDKIVLYFKQIGWLWFVTLLTTITFVYGEAILNVVQQQPPAYVVYLTIFLAILFGGLTIYYNVGKLLIDSFKDIATENKSKSISLEKTTKDLEKQSKELQTKTSLARKMTMNTVTEVKTVQGQVIALKEQLGHVEIRLNSLETRFDGLETRFDQLQVHVDEQFKGVNSQLEIITALLQNRTN
jgi:chaperonin cofactor prefoldin